MASAMAVKVDIPCGLHASSEPGQLVEKDLEMPLRPTSYVLLGDVVKVHQNMKVKHAS